MSSVTEVKVFGPENSSQVEVSQSLTNSTTSLAGEALNTSGQGFSNVAQQNFHSRDNLLSCSQIFIKENNEKTEHETVKSKIAERNKFSEECTNFVKMVQTDQQPLDVVLTAYKKIQKEQIWLNMTTEQKLQFVAEKLNTRSEKYQKIQQEALQVKFQEKTGLEKTLQTNQTRLREIGVRIERVESDVMASLNQLGPSKRNSPETGKANEALYENLIRQHSNNASIQLQLELCDQIATGRLEHIPEGKHIAQTIKGHMEILQKFQYQSVNTEEGKFGYIYVRVEKEPDCKQLVLEAQHNFLKDLKDAIAFKAKSQTFLKKFELISRNIKFPTDLAFGNDDQAKINIKSFNAVQEEGLRMRDDLMKDMIGTWKIIWINLEKQYTKLKLFEEAIKIRTDRDKQMYFYSETTIEGGGISVLSYKDPAYVLSADINAVEVMPESYPYLSLEEEAAKAESEVKQEAAIEDQQEEVKAEHVGQTPTEEVTENLNQAAVASQLAATGNEQAEEPEIKSNVNSELVTGTV